MLLRRAAARINSLPIAAKAFAGSAVLLISLVSIGVLSVQSLNSVAQRLETTVHSSIAKSSSKERMIDALSEAHLNVFRFMAWAGSGMNERLLAEVRSEIRRSDAAVEARLAYLAGRDDLSPVEREEVRLFAESWEQYIRSARQAIEAATRDPAAGAALLGAVDDEFRSAALHLRRLTVAARSQNRIAVEALREQAADEARLILTGGLTAIVVALAIAFYFVRSIIVPVRSVTQAMREISFGNLDFHPERAYEDRTDEIGQMVAAIATFCQEMRETREALERNQRDLRDQNIRLDAALGLMSQGLCMFDRDMRLVMSNRRYAEIYGLDPDLMRPGTPLTEVLRRRIEAGTYPGGDPEAYIRERLAAVAESEPTLKVHQLIDGRSIAISHRPMEGGGWLDTHEDITEIRRIEAQIAHMARHDGLTDLPNRMTFHQALAAACAARSGSRPLAVLFLDLDRFKSVNDTLGHMAGDLLLKAVAGRLQECLRQNDLVARLSGDEFAVLLPVLRSREDAAAVAWRIVAAIARPFEVEGHRVSIGASIGIAIHSDEEDSPDELLRNADTALYRAKADGRGVFRFYDPGMDDLIQRGRQLEIDLHRAIRDHELELYFQPIIDLASEAVVALEALLRWAHPEHGPIPPAEFIPAAEATGAIEELGEWVIRQACLEAARWPGQLRVSVNLSSLQFGKQDLVRLVTDALEQAGLAPDRLELEITESVLLHDSETNLRILHELRALGVRIAMDDFGTGYSSLGYLRSFPFDKIKIDRAFIREIPGDPGSGAIVRAVAHLAASLGMTATAEGVETPEQLDYLRQQGCTEVQGFLFSPALPGREVPALLARLAEEAADRRLLAAGADAPDAARAGRMRLIDRTGS